MRNAVLSVVLSHLFLPAAFGQSPVRFNRDIRPILSDACFACHGPDAAKRKAKLDLSTEAGSRTEGSTGIPIVASKPMESEVYRRIVSDDKSVRMPPSNGHSALSKAQIEKIRQWIADGGKYEKHWSLEKPVVSPMPKVTKEAWVRSPIDRFVLARLEAAGLSPSPEADRATLLRRLSFDITGLPPSLKELDDFLNDQRPDAYERVVDRLLQSPRYGERMAQRWLDAARYADTNGYQTDGERTMWPWRNWVINAFNANMPFDQFTIEQLAGDLLPNATLEQRIATGFNRNHRGNSEGGVIPEEYAVEYVADRVDTTSTVWLGLTFGCCRCHSHKYDPLTQTEYYQFFAFFNNVPERGKAIKYGNSPPYIKAPSKEQRIEGQRLAQQAAAARDDWEQYVQGVTIDALNWAVTNVKTPAELIPDWSFTRNMQARFRLDSENDAARRMGKVELAKPDVEDTLPRSLLGSIRLNGDGFVAADSAGDFSFFDRFSVGAWIKVDNGNAGPVFSRMTDVNQGDGYQLVIKDGRIEVDLVKRWLDDSIRVQTRKTIKPGYWRHVMFTYDGSRTAGGVAIYVDGQRLENEVVLDDLNQNFQNKEPFRIGAGGGARFRGQIADVRIFGGVVDASNVAILATPKTIAEISRMPARSISHGVLAKLRAFTLETLSPQDTRDKFETMLKAERDHKAWLDDIPTTMVMEEMPVPRKTHLLLRGEYDKKGPQVFPGTPNSLPAFSKTQPTNRLGLARWLVDRDNPLTARVAVNRVWQMLFGAGLVKTVEDFGAQGEWPSHPELLDWLAIQFQETGWDQKALIKTIVTSATYRQSSRVTADGLHKDPENRLLGRGPRFRLSAQMIRDQALLASGLLVEKLGGPSVRPYRPEGIEKELHGTEDYAQDHGPNLYRRSLYTFWKRTVAPPNLTTFDAANRETCVVRESRTNTPLQALNLMNDVTYVEAARVMAQRAMESKADRSVRLANMFRKLTSRSPDGREAKLLDSAWQRHHEHYMQHREDARSLTETGEYPGADGLDLAEWAAYTAVATTLMNLDEAITRQ